MTRRKMVDLYKEIEDLKKLLAKARRDNDVITKLTIEHIQRLVTERDALKALANAGENT